jgi:hypothetical protein
MLLCSLALVGRRCCLQYLGDNYLSALPWYVSRGSRPRDRDYCAARERGHSVHETTKCPIQFLA